MTATYENNAMNDDDRKKTSIRRRFGLVCFSVLISLSIVECVLRLAFAKEQVLPPYYFNRETRFVEHPFLPYAHAANDVRTLPWRHEFFGPFTLKYRTNRYGFLGDEFPSQKASNEIRILTFGGSTTWCMGIDPTTRIGTLDATWPAILQQLLQAKLPDSVVSVINLAQDGYSSPMSVVNLAFVGVDLKPDFVLDYDGINDMAQTFGFPMRSDYVGRFSPMKAYRSVGTRLPRVLFKSHLVCLAVKAADNAIFYENRGAFAGILPPPKPKGVNFWDCSDFRNSDLFLRNIRTMRGLCNEYGIKFIGSTCHYFQTDSTRDEFNNMIRTYYAKEAVPFFDADRMVPKNDKSVNTDEVHFTKRGTELMAQGFCDLVLQSLKTTTLGK